MNNKAVILGSALFVIAGAAVLFFLNRYEPPTGEPAPPPTESAETVPNPAAPSEPDVLVATEPMEIVPAGSSETITYQGIVQNAETSAPISGAEIYIEKHGDEVEPVKTDDEGNFSIQLTEEEALVSQFIVSRADGFALNRKEIESLGAIEPGAELFVTFLLHPGITISGTVTDAATGERIAEAKVRLVDAKSSMMQAARQGNDAQQDDTNEEGMYRLDNTAPGAYRVIVDARAQGYIFDTNAATVVNVEEERSYNDINFKLARGGTLTGRITNLQNAPVAGAKAALVPAQMIQGIFQDPDMLMMMGQGDSIRSNENGEFQMLGLNFDFDYRVMIEADNYAPANSEVFQLVRANPSHRVGFILTAGSTLTGTAVFEDGTPAADHEVMLMPDLGDIMTGAFSGGDDADTDESGTFTFTTVAAGSYRVHSADFMKAFAENPESANPLDMFGDEEPFEVDGINPVSDLVVVVKRAAPGMGVIQGIVITSEGQPVQGIRVSAATTGALAAQPVNVDTDESGNFIFEKLKSQVYDLSVKSNKGTAKLGGVAVGMNVTMKLAAPVRITGRVVDDQNRPVADSRVQYEPIAVLEDSSFNMQTFMMSFMGAGNKSINTDDDGNFEFTNLDLGDYKFKAKSPSKGTGTTQKVTVRGGQNIAGLVIQLEKGVTISGTVVDTSGARVSGATVSLVAGGSDNPNDLIMRFLPDTMKEKAGTASSDEQGVFRMANVPAATYLVTATSQGYAATRQPGLKIEPKRDVTNLRLVLSGGGCVSGIARIGGTAKAGNMVQLNGESGMHMSATDAQGHFEICTITPGTYMATAIDIAKATSGDLANATSRVLVVDVGDGDNLTLNFDPPTDGIAVRGTISGNLGIMTTVSLRREGGPLPEEVDVFDQVSQIEMMRYIAGQTIATPDGSFDLGAVEPGEYVLEVSSMDINPGDVGAMMNADRTPQIRKNIKIKEGSDPVHFDLNF